MVKCISAKAPAEVVTTDETSKKPEELPDLLTKQLVKCQKIKAPVKVATTNEAITTADDSVALLTEKPPQPSVQHTKVKPRAKVSTTKNATTSQVQNKEAATPAEVTRETSKTSEDLAAFLTKQTPQPQVQQTTPTASTTVDTNTHAAKSPEDLEAFLKKQYSQVKNTTATELFESTAENLAAFPTTQTVQSQFPSITNATFGEAISTGGISTSSDDLAAFLSKQPPHSTVQPKVANLPTEVPATNQASNTSTDLASFLTKQPPHSSVPQTTATNTTTTPNSSAESTQKPVQSPQTQPKKEDVNVSVNPSILNADDTSRITFTQTANSNSESLLLGVILNRREVGSLDVMRQGNSLLLPLEDFAKLAGFTVAIKENITQLNTPLGVINLAEDEIQNIKGVTYISDAIVKEKLSSRVEFNSLDLALIVDLPWSRNGRNTLAQSFNLQPEVFAPISGFSNFRQELNIVSNSGDFSLQSSTLLGGRLAGGLWRVRLNNNFENTPNLTEYFYYKRNNRFLYQLGRQQVSLNPLLNGLNLTGAQIGYTNLPAENFRITNSANEILPRRSRPIQTFEGVAPPASFVQLRVAGVVIAQQQVGFDGRYEFIDVNLPVGQNNQIELLIYDRNNLSIPIEIRTVRVNASDLLLPAGGNVQLAGLGINGNLAQNALLDNVNFEGSNQPVGFYQLRQGLSDNLTLEASLQAVPNALQSQAGFVWRLANPVIFSASVGNSFDKLAYNTDLDIQLGSFDLRANSQLVPAGYRSGTKSGEFSNHSAELNYRFNNNFQLGFLARSRKSDSDSADYISPTFSFRPFSSLYLSGRPDIDGLYLFNAFYQVNRVSRLSFNTFGDRYRTDFSYDFTRNYQLSLGSDFGGDFATRYTATVSHSPYSLRQLSWRLGVAFSDGEVGPIAGASMQVLPGLFARVEYQGIPIRSNRSTFGVFGDDRLTVSLVSDLSFAGGRAVPSNFTSLGKDRGAIAGRITVSGENNGYNLQGASVRVINNQNKPVGGAKTDSSGNFFVGGLPEGVYRVEVDPEQLPVELTLPKTSRVAEVGMAGVTNLDFAARLEYGLAGRITDVTGQPMSEVRVELVNLAGTEVLSAMTDQFGLYRVDGVPVGKYTLRVPSQDAIANSETLPKREVTIRNEFVYDQNLQLPISTAVKEIKEK
ncbi:carboxypeptidase regulatory-like domain-containing protein [Fortiea sp. LEGE XX443]|nr:carboxypeptidase regulatory-like domain-containing protein [Fortiea sp. LEGE XX443]